MGASNFNASVSASVNAFSSDLIYVNIRLQYSELAVGPQYNPYRLDYYNVTEVAL